MDWPMMIGKAIVYAIVILILTEIAKRNAFIAAVIIAFPVMTVLTVANLYMETGETAAAFKLANSTFWLIVASLAFFLVFLLCQKVGLAFWAALGISVVCAVISIIGFTFVLKRFGINLMSNV